MTDLPQSRQDNKEIEAPLHWTHARRLGQHFSVLSRDEVLEPFATDRGEDNHSLGLEESVELGRGGAQIAKSLITRQSLLLDLIDMRSDETKRTLPTSRHPRSLENLPLKTPMIYNELPVTQLHATSLQDPGALFAMS